MNESAASSPPAVPPRASERSGRGAFLVAMGIFSSRIVGLLRERVFAHYLGNSLEAGAFKAALRIPNFLQNLFGEGVLSGSFIPVYAQLLGQRRDEEADRLAAAIFALLTLVTSVLVAIGMLATPLFVDVIAPGFEGETRALTIRLVRILFPGTGLLVLSAWCLGILNSHRRFFLSYAAPVVWNLALIGTLVVFGGRVEQARLAELLAYGAVLGSLLQLAVQVPSVLRLLGRFRPALGLALEPVRRVIRSFGAVVIGRGVVQISAYVDTALASLLSARALSALAYAQTIYLIPVSLFGMAVSAAELPEMSRATGTAEEIAEKLKARLAAGARRIAFFVVPSAAAFLFLGDVVAGALLQTGRFSAADTRYVWYLLMGASVGLLAATLARLYASAFYALKDPATPLRIALVRVAVGAGAAYVLGLHLPGWLGLPRHLGAAFITASSGLAAWLELVLLRRRLAHRLGPSGLPRGLLSSLWSSALVAAGVGVALKAVLIASVGSLWLAEWGGGMLQPPALHPLWTAVVVLIPYGLVYVGLLAAGGNPEAVGLLRRIVRRRPRSGAGPG